MIERTSIRVIRRKSGQIHAELQVWTSSDNVSTAWEILGIRTDAPYCIVDGHRQDLTQHQIGHLRKNIEDLEKEAAEEGRKDTVPAGRVRQAGRKGARR